MPWQNTYYHPQLGEFKGSIFDDLEVCRKAAEDELRREPKTSLVSIDSVDGPQPPYPWCHTPERCTKIGYCPREHSCGD